jgi:hypothetical protein
VPILFQIGQNIFIRGATTLKRDRPEGPLSPERTGRKGHYVQKQPGRLTITLRRDQLKGPLRLKGTGLKVHCNQKGPAQMAITFSKDGPV